jgi:hypothetical protein
MTHIGELSPTRGLRILDPATSLPGNQRVADQIAA